MKDRSRVALAAALLMVGAACQQSAPPAVRPSPAVSPIAAPAPPPAAAIPFKIAAVELGRELGTNKRVTSPTTSFGAHDTVCASVSSEGSAPKVTLKARWTYQDGQLVDESVQSIAPTGPTTTEFHVAKPSDWPAGNYKVEISADGTTATTREFVVRAEP